MTRLVRNYRCHQPILGFHSYLFCKGEFVACNEETELSLSNWSELPSKGFNVIFSGILGFDERECSDPSWFNLFEVRKVVEIEKKLTDDIADHLQVEDIGVITTPPTSAKGKESFEIPRLGWC